jgi:hypothetical protein
MKKLILSMALLGVFVLFSAQEAHSQLAGALAGKVGKGKGGKGGGGGSFTAFNDETDAMGVTGEYFGLSDGKAYGLRFVKEEGGKMVNKLHYFEKKGDEPQLKLDLKENYYTKHQVKLFYFWISASASGYVELVEVDPGVIAQIKSDRSYNDGPVGLDATRTVVDVYAKDKASFDTWDVETAQAKLDMLIGSLKAEESEKTKKNLMKFESYGGYVGKIAFAKGTNYLRNQRENEPVEKVANFITKAELGSTVAYKPYFEMPLEVSHPGAWFNITYEMLGETTDREVLRKTSSVFSENIPQIDKDKSLFYFLFPRVTVDNSSNAADYAFLELLRKNQGKLKEGGVYDLKVTVWAYKDGANIDPVASGTIQLEYTKEATGTKKLLFDPVEGWVSKLEKVLD